MAEKIIYRTADGLEFKRYWNELLNAKKATYRYFLENLDTVLIISKSKQYLVEDKSFIYVVNNIPVAGVFLPIERIDGTLFASANGSYIDAPLIADTNFEKKIYSLIDEIAAGSKLASVKFSIDPLIDFPACNILQKYGYLDATIIDYVIELDQEAELIKYVRRGHASDIKKILSDDRYRIFFSDAGNADRQIFSRYCELHHKCAGRVTRPEETFDLQFKKIADGKALLAGLELDGRAIAFLYFEHSFDKAVYYSGADDPEYDRLPLYHVLLYSAMEYFQKHRIRLIDTTQPSCPSRQFDYYPDKKQLNIALFKRGFGGNFYSYFRGIKYFDRLAFEADLDNLKNNYYKE